MCFVSIIIVALAVILLLATRQSGHFRYTRTIMINASPVTIFGYANDLHKWNDWSPWAKIDPNCQTTYEGPEDGVGAIMRWNGNKEIGQGSMSIMQSTAPSLVRYKLEFLKPFKATNTAELVFTPVGDQTLVSWSMYGENPFMGKVFGLLMNCKDMLEKQFDQGLAQLKTLAERK